MLENSKIEKNQNNKRFQNIIVENRSAASITGVLHVESFNESTILLETDLGMLEIRGEELHIKKLNLDNNSGELEVEGGIYGLEYFDEDYKEKSAGFFSKLFK